MNHDPRLGAESVPPVDAPETNDGADTLPRLLTVRELAALLGLHEKTIYDWTARRVVPCVRLGNRLRFDPHDVTRWLSARKEGETCRSYREE